MCNIIFVEEQEHKNLRFVCGVDRKIFHEGQCLASRACRVMPDCDPEGWIILYAPHTHLRFFFSSKPFISEHGFLIMQSLQLLTSTIF